MKMLTENQFNNARKFIKANARALDCRLFEFFFEQGSVEAAAKELSMFQNEDGGFGQSIEPDFRFDISSPMATTIGLQYAKELKLTSEHPIVQKAIKYLLDAFDYEKKEWPAVPEQVNQVPHAPWWNFDIEKGHCGTHSSWANPNAEIVGYLREYSELVPKPFLKFVTDLALDEFNKLPESMEMHDFLCYQRLLETLQAHDKEVVFEKLKKSAREITVLDPDGWSGYGLKPLQAAPSADSPFTGIFNEELPMNLDYEINNLSTEGSWNPSWSWYGQYEEDWKTAEKEWKGHLTVKMLKTLREFGRIKTASNV